MSFNNTLAKKLSTPWKLRAWMLTKLPMGLLSGMKIVAINEHSCQVVLKERWWIRNPFGSVFWAVMGMAAELSTGALVYAYASSGEIKFILVGMEATFIKKAKGVTIYTCEEGQLIQVAMNGKWEPDESKLVVLPAIAKDATGQVLATFVFQWQLKRKSD